MPAGTVVPNGPGTVAEALAPIRAELLGELDQLEKQAHRVNDCKADAERLRERIRANEAALKAKRADAVLDGESRPVEPPALRIDRARLAELDETIPETERRLAAATAKARAALARYLNSEADRREERIGAALLDAGAKVAESLAPVAEIIGDRAAMEQILRQDTHLGKAIAERFMSTADPRRGGLASVARAWNFDGAALLQETDPLNLVRAARDLFDKFKE